MKFNTRLVSFDPCPDDPFRPVATPIYQTATFEQECADSFGPYDYSRSGNPTRTVLEQQLARLENGTRAFCFASGMAAITSVARLLSPGDEILAADDLYGGAYRLFSKILRHTGITVRYVNASNLDAVREAIQPRTRLIYIETPTNPLLQIIDIAGIAELAKKHDILFCVDNSVMSPYLQLPLDLGADIVLHSATKFLCGHGDVTGGVVVVKDPQLVQDIYLIQNGEGAALGPFDCFLLLRGLKTMSLRMDAQQARAQKLTAFLSEHPLVKKVYFPGLPNHPGHHLHASQARGFGSVISFETGSFELSRKVAEATQLFAITVSFGSLNSTISLPGSMSHASVPPELRATRYLPADLVRISVGIEDPDDLIDDLGKAFQGSAVNSDQTHSVAKVR